MNKGAPRTVEDVIDTLRNEQQLRTDALTTGTPQDYASYLRIVGAISGLGIAEQLLKVLLESNADDDGTEDRRS